MLENIASFSFNSSTQTSHGFVGRIYCKLNMHIFKISKLHTDETVGSEDEILCCDLRYILLICTRKHTEKFSAHPQSVVTCHFLSTHQTLLASCAQLQVLLSYANDKKMHSGMLVSTVQKPHLHFVTSLDNWKRRSKRFENTFESIKSLLPKGQKSAL